MLISIVKTRLRKRVRLWGDAPLIKDEESHQVFKIDNIQRALDGIQAAGVTADSDRAIAAVMEDGETAVRGLDVDIIIPIVSRIREKGSRKAGGARDNKSIASGASCDP